MRIDQVLDRVIPAEGIPDAVRGTDVHGLEYDSRNVRRGAIFFAFAGSKVDGRQFARQAVDAGAIAIVSEFPALEGLENIWIRVPHGRQALATACRNFFGPPERDLRLTGVTGTNGKTTTTYLVDAVARAAGLRTGVLGTIGNRICGETVPAVNTTPESLDLYRLLEQVRSKGGTHVAMEVSSHALALGRVFAVAYHTAIFTNLTQDHLDFHHTMEEYFAAKSLLFQGNGAAAPKFAVINSDDAYGARIQTAAGTQAILYGLGEGAGLRATDIRMGFEGTRFTLHYGGRTLPIRSPMVGQVNVYNILAACGAGISYGFDWTAIATGIAECGAVPGRFERVDEGQPFLVVVDYAHTDDALRNAIRVARTLNPKRVITVFGCGGDRDRSKRPLMGKAASELSDMVVVTSDNPRSEDPRDIINDIMVGVQRGDSAHMVELDRRKAIGLAMAEARAGDMVLIAGKGHETYQILRDRTIDFDDREVARQTLHQAGYRKQT